jgi:hypothetical protein
MARGTVGKKQKFCAITKKIHFLPFWTIPRTFWENGFLIRPHPRVLCLLTETLLWPWEPQFSTKSALIQNVTVFCLHHYFLENKFFDQTTS